MPHRIRALAGVLTILLAAGCVSVARDQRASQAQEPPAMAPVTIPGHPPVTASGMVASFDPSTEILHFDDGRMVKLTGQSKVVTPVANPIRVGDLVVLQNVLPVGVQAGVKTLALGRPQRMGTIASIDEDSGLVQMTDGTLVRVTRTTNLHLGAASSSVTLTQVSPADELVVVFGDADATDSASADDATASSSALPRQDASLPGVEAGEVMIFRTPRRP